jgi:hypothetical protein
LHFFEHSRADSLAQAARLLFEAGTSLVRRKPIFHSAGWRRPERRLGLVDTIRQPAVRVVRPGGRPIRVHERSAARFGDLHVDDLD